MASRQEEKEARRAARLAEEAKEAKSAAARKRLQMVFGGVLGVLIIAGVVVAILAASGGGKDKDAPKQASTNSNVKLPTAATTDLQSAVDAAGCATAQHPIEGRTHEDKVFTEADYKTNPPTSGNHFPDWAQDGIYTEANEPQLGKLVHPLEHGRIEVQYKPGTDQATIDKFEAFLAETEGYHELLFPNETGAEGALNATAWGYSLNCPTVNDKTWDALRTFRDAHIDKGPETVP